MWHHMHHEIGYHGRGSPEDIPTFCRSIYPPPGHTHPTPGYYHPALDISTPPSSGHTLPYTGHNHMPLDIPTCLWKYPPTMKHTYPLDIPTPSGHNQPPASDIWRSSLETCSNLSTCGPAFHQYWHLVVATDAHSTHPTWMLSFSLCRWTFIFQKWYAWQIRSRRVGLSTFTVLGSWNQCLLAYAKSCSSFTYKGQHLPIMTTAAEYNNSFGLYRMVTFS